MKNVVGLLRVSGQDQKKGHGFERQQQKIMEYAQGHQLNILKIFRQQITGTSQVLTRDSVQELMALCKDQGIDTILVENAGRFARDKDTAIKGMYALREEGFVSVIFCDKGMDFFAEWQKDSLNAIIPFLEISFAEKEKNDLVEKLAKARKAKRDSGQKCDGRKRYGETREPRELELIKRAKHLRGRLKYSYDKTAKILNEEGFTTRKGTPLTAPQVQRLTA